MMGSYNLLYELATEGLARGVEARVRPRTRWWPAAAAPRASCCRPTGRSRCSEFFGVDRLRMGYGMSEISAMHMMCESGRYHVQPWVIPYVLDPDTNEPLPREGVQVGRAAFYDPAYDSHWGGIMSGDEIELELRALLVRPDEPPHRARHRALQREAGRRPHHLRGHPAAPARGHRLPEGDRVMSGVRRPDGRARRGGRGRLGAPSAAASAGIEFRAPDPAIHVDRLPLATPDGHGRPATSLSFDDIVDVPRPAREGPRLRHEHARPGRPRRRLGARPGSPPSILRQNYRSLPIWFDPRVRPRDGRRDDRHRPPRGLGRADAASTAARQRIRAFGSRAVHIVAGNSPVLSGGDGHPQRGHPQRRHHQDAVERPAHRGRDRPHDVRVDPDHPLTKHLAVAYWKGGDVARRGAALPARARREDRGVGRLRVGEARDPLPPAGARDDRPRPQAQRVDHRARGVRVRRRPWPRWPARSPATSASQNQEGCACARVIYVLSGTDAEGIARLDRLGELIYEAILDLPEDVQHQAAALRPRAARLPRRASGSTTTGTA